MRKAPSYSLIREAQINAFLILLGARLQILSEWIHNSSPIVAKEYPEYVGHFLLEFFIRR